MQRILQEIIKKNTLGWWVICPSEPAYYIVDCWISNLNLFIVETIQPQPLYCVETVQCWAIAQACSCMVRKIFRINLCLLLPEAKKKGGSILLTAGLPQNRSWRSIIPNWQLNGFLCFAFFDSIKRRSMARSLSQPYCKYFHCRYYNFSLNPDFICTSAALLKL